MIYITNVLSDPCIVLVQVRKNLITLKLDSARNLKQTPIPHLLQQIKLPNRHRCADKKKYSKADTS